LNLTKNRHTTPSKPRLGQITRCVTGPDDPLNENQKLPSPRNPAIFRSRSCLRKYSTRPQKKIPRNLLTCLDCALFLPCFIIPTLFLIFLPCFTFLSCYYTPFYISTLFHMTIDLSLINSYSFLYTFCLYVPQKIVLKSFTQRWDRGICQERSMRWQEASKGD
jgi:hypothetical protein